MGISINRVQHQWFLPGFCWNALRNPHWGVLLAIVFCCVAVVPARAQQQQPPEDPEDEKQIGLWLDEGISAGLSTNKSLEVEFHERFDEGAPICSSTSFRAVLHSVCGRGLP